MGPVASNRLTVGILLETNLGRICILLAAYTRLCLKVNHSQRLSLKNDA